MLRGHQVTSPSRVSDEKGDVSMRFSLGRGTVISVIVMSIASDCAVKCVCCSMLSE